MSTHKLVPVEPTQEMIDAGRTARTHPAERYKAMLAAAPDFDRHVIAEVNENDDGQWADILPDRHVYLGQPLYAVMQPAPDVTILVETLESIAEYWNQDSNEGAMRDACEYARSAALAALAAYRKKGGES